MAFIRSLLKSGAMTLLACYGWLRIRFSKRPTLLILTYHRILPASAPERLSEQPGMITTPETLEQHIRFTRKLGAEAVHLNDWLKRNNLGERLPKLSVAFTFDDGWRDNYQYAFPRLRAEHTPATIFLVTSMIGSQNIFWPEQVLRLLTSTVVPRKDPSFDWLRPHLPATTNPLTAPLSLKDADSVISRLKSMEDTIIIGELQKLYETHPELAPQDQSRSILNAAEISEMSKTGLIAYGAHTRHHFRLNRLKDDQVLKEEIVDCMQDVKSLSPAAIPVFCYPNGDITGNGKALVSEHYDAACTTKTGWNVAGCNPFDLHRFNLHDGNSGSNRDLLATIGRGLL